MRTGLRVAGLTGVAVVSSAVTLVVLARKGLAMELDRVRTITIPGLARCEDWCVCQCHQVGCGCHDGRPRK